MKSILIFLLVALSPCCFAQKEFTFSINGSVRKALIFEPEKTAEKMPLVFVFHGHGGNAKYAAAKMDFQDYFPEALVVFMQGIPGTSGRVIDKQGLLNGWQMFPNENGNRDVLFFDEVLKEVQGKYPIDSQRIYLVGHSNGARFVNVLWKERGEKIAAICSVAAQGGLMVKNAKPISIWMSMGKNDPLVPYRQQKSAVPIVKKNLQTDENSKVEDGEITTFKGINNTELVLEERNAGHEFPHESIPGMVAFFKRHHR
ncbi:alpha/beta hydrolase family esterase [Chryseobacterium sp. R2A-55]|uniref:alpha/beta hydrolase family esterase n=1 Tax=Chryseobacterium sp. R2A-55 TaxID=2744445 RepID=UPI001F3BD5ED|nr:hypothetical protein [Chryseobacterium sp. R2A-55]